MYDVMTTGSCDLHYSPCIATQSLYVSSGGSLTADRRSTPECSEACYIETHILHTHLLRTK